MKEFWAKTLLTILALFSLTLGIYLYTSGYRVSRNENTTIDLRRTGMIGAKSLPQGANVYINGVLKTATNDNVAALDPGNYQVRITKSGFVPWEKEIEVYAELVSDITAVLIPQSPRLEPLTNTGARNPAMSHSLRQLAYFSTAEGQSGIWIIPLSTSGISLFRAEPYTAFEDSFNRTLSTGTSISWAPDEKQLLVEDEEGFYHLVNISNRTAQTIQDHEELLKTWEEELAIKRSDFMLKIDIPKEMFEIAISSSSQWSPDDRKFLYTVENEDEIEYRVFNMEKPLPVGEKTDYLVFTKNVEEEQPNISWYSDSYHLIVVENYDDDANRGKISLIRIDGTNKTEMYNSTMFSNKAYSTANGDKVIFLTTFKSFVQTDLYTISIR